MFSDIQSSLSFLQATLTPTAVRSLSLRLVCDTHASERETYLSVLNVPRSGYTCRIKSMPSVPGQRKKAMPNKLLKYRSNAAKQCLKQYQVLHYRMIVEYEVCQQPEHSTVIHHYNRLRGIISQARCFLVITPRPHFANVSSHSSSPMPLSGSCARV